MKRTLIVLFALPLAVGTARADDAARTLVLTRLGGMEDAPSAADFADIPSASTELLAIAKDSSVPHSRRGNAIVALGWFPVDAHRDYLAGLLKDTLADPFLRKKAVFGLANGWGDSALPTIELALTSPDVQLRMAAVHALARIGSKTALGLLRARLETESDPAVRESLSAALK